MTIKVRSIIFSVSSRIRIQNSERRPGQLMDNSTLQSASKTKWQQQCHRPQKLCRPAISLVCCLKRSNTIKIFYQQPRHLELNSKQLGALWEPRLMLFVQCPDFHRSEETCAGDIRVQKPGPGIRSVICREIVTLGSGPAVSHPSPRHNNITPVFVI